MRGNRKPRRMTPEGEEAQCSKCKEWLFCEPEADGNRDGLGFRIAADGYLVSWCRACEAEAKKLRRYRMVEPLQVAA